MKLQQGSDAAEEIVELARNCVEYVARTVGFELDYSLETLPAVDQYTRHVSDEVEGRPELLPLVAPAVGAYFGEVLCRAFDGFWRVPSPNMHDWQICMRTAFLWLNPIGVAYDALARGDEHGGPRSPIRVAPEDRDLVKNRLSGFPLMESDEYYLLSTRAEVVQLVLETLHARLEARGYGDEALEASDYEAEFRPIGEG